MLTELALLIHTCVNVVRKAKLLSMYYCDVLDIWKH